MRLHCDGCGRDVFMLMWGGEKYFCPECDDVPYGGIPWITESPAKNVMVVGGERREQ